MSAAGSTQEAPRQEVQLVIGGMTCASCAARVERRLNRMPGVEATVNLATEKARVLLPEGTEVADAIATVRSTGYTARPVTGLPGAPTAPPPPSPTPAAPKATSGPEMLGMPTIGLPTREHGSAGHAEHDHAEHDHAEPAHAEHDHRRDGSGSRPLGSHLG